MKRKMKVTLSLLLVVAMVFGNGIASTEKKTETGTSIHLHISNDFGLNITGGNIKVVVLVENDSEDNETLTWDMSGKNDKNAKVFDVSDGGEYVSGKILHFLINDIVFTYGPEGEVQPRGQEGWGGTINCELVKLPSVSLVYDANGADDGVVPDSQTMNIYSTFTVSDNIGALSLTGNEFNGWNTMADGTGVDYVVGSSYSIGTSNLTLFAQWKPVYPVKYHANPVSGFTLSGSVPTDSNLYQISKNVTVMDKGTLSLSRHDFDGWTLTETGEGSPYNAGNNVQMIENGLNFYAKWTMHSKYNVSYNGNGSTSGSVPSSSSYFEGETVTVSSIGDLIKEGFTFNGWNTAANGTGTQRGAGTTFEIGAADVVLYAQWKQNQVDSPKFEVAYNLNGGTGTAPIDENKYEQGELVTVKSSNVTRTNFKFSGWSMSSEGTETVYNNSETFYMPAKNVTLYAIWAPLYTVTYYSNYDGGVAPVDEKEYLSGAEVTVLEEMTRDYFDFINWNTSADGSGTSYESDAVFLMKNSNVSLYAQWEEHDKFKVTYDPNGATGGTVPVDSGLYHKNQSTIVLGNVNALIKTGFKFNGWNTAVNGSGTSYDENDNLVFSTGDIVLYAMWQIEEDNPPQPTTPSEEPPSEEPPSEEPPSEEPPTPEPTTAAPTTQSTEELDEEEPVALSAPIEFFNIDQYLVEPTYEEVVEIEIDEPTPLGSALPQTGQLPAELFYGIGGLITAAGAFMKKRK